MKTFASSKVPHFIPNGIATVEVTYFYPDRPLIIAPPLLWKTADYYPDYPRILRFLYFWRTNIDALIERILLTHELSTSKREMGIEELPSFLN